MNRYFKQYRESMKRLSKMDTILEEIYVIEKETDTSDWNDLWHHADWGQWSDIEYIDVNAEAEFQYIS